MLTSDKYVRVSLDLPKEEYRKLHRLMETRGWTKAWFLRIITITAVQLVETSEALNQRDIEGLLSKVK